MKSRSEEINLHLQPLITSMSALESESLAEAVISVPFTIGSLQRPYIESLLLSQRNVTRILPHDRIKKERKEEEEGNGMRLTFSFLHKVGCRRARCVSALARAQIFQFLPINLCLAGLIQINSSSRRGTALSSSALHLVIVAFIAAPKVLIDRSLTIGADFYCRLVNFHPLETFLTHRRHQLTSLTVNLLLMSDNFSF